MSDSKRFRLISAQVRRNEGEFVAIRESSASMSVARAASLIDYLLAFCAMNEVDLIETRRGGFDQPARVEVAA